MSDAKNEADSGASTSDAKLDVQFVTDPDELGRGRVIVNGRYFSLPMAAVKDYQALRDEVKLWRRMGTALHDAGLREINAARL